MKIGVTYLNLQRPAAREEIQLMQLSNSEKIDLVPYKYLKGPLGQRIHSRFILQYLTAGLVIGWSNDNYQAFNRSFNREKEANELVQITRKH